MQSKKMPSCEIRARRRFWALRGAEKGGPGRRDSDGRRRPSPAAASPRALQQKSGGREAALVSLLDQRKNDRLPRHAYRSRDTTTPMSCSRGSARNSPSVSPLRLPRSVRPAVQPCRRYCRPCSLRNAGGLPFVQRLSVSAGREPGWCQTPSRWTSPHS
jgi:hypothetical protein